MKLENSWGVALQEELDKPYIVDLKKFLTKERDSQVIYPKEEDVFSAFSHTPFEKVKVVIVGQDPYHGMNQAHGLSFSVPKGEKIPPSLRNIYKELKEDLGIKPPEHGNLLSWAKQGVLLLNATLTVREGEPKSHYGMGWEIFTDHVLEVLCERNDPLIFVLWGASAQEKVSRIFSKKTGQPHLILTAAHPSPLSATKFLGCKHFSKINQQLTQWNKEPIKWDLNES